MSWPPALERWRLDGEVRRRAAPLLGEMVSALGRLKAIFAGLADDDRPVVLDAPAEPGEVGASRETAGFVPGRFVAVRWLDEEERRAATNPFAGLADRALKLLVPELEISLTELTVLLNEYLFHQEHELEELLDALPGEVLAGLEQAMPRWADDAPRQAAEIARLRGHLARETRRPEPGSPITDLRRALVWTIAWASGRHEAPEAKQPYVSAAADRAVGPLRELLEALEERPGA